MDEGGLFSHLQKTIYTEKTYEDKNDVEMTKLGYENVAFPCLVLIMGSLVALLYLAAEWQWTLVKNYRENKSGKGPLLYKLEKKRCVGHVGTPYE